MNRTSTASWPRSTTLYTPSERRRRDASRWTLVQGILAPAQFLAFLISLGLVIRFLATGEGWTSAALSVLVKTALLYGIMVTGSLWERDVFGRYLFARPFFWEDVVSILVLALHTLYVAGLFLGWMPPDQLMRVALAAYGLYLLNAAQFLVKLRQARTDRATAS